MFFPPSRAVLSAILRDEYLTSAVRNEKPSNQEKKGAILVKWAV